MKFFVGSECTFKLIFSMDLEGEGEEVHSDGMSGRFLMENEQPVNYIYWSAKQKTLGKLEVRITCRRKRQSSIMISISPLLYAGREVRLFLKIINFCFKDICRLIINVYSL